MTAKEGPVRDWRETEVWRAAISPNADEEDAEYVLGVIHLYTNATSPRSIKNSHTPCETLGFDKGVRGMECVEKVVRHQSRHITPFVHVRFEGVSIRECVWAASRSRTSPDLWTLSAARYGEGRKRFADGVPNLQKRLEWIEEV